MIHACPFMDILKVDESFWRRACHQKSEYKSISKKLKTTHKLIDERESRMHKVSSHFSKSGYTKFCS